MTTVTGEASSGEANPAFADLHKAMDDVDDLFGIDALQTLGITWQDIQPKATKKHRKTSTMPSWIPFTTIGT